MKKPILVFDLDGVLFDTVDTMIESLMNTYPGVTKDMVYELFFGNFHEQVQKIVHLKKVETDEEKEERRLAYSLKKVEARMFLGIKELLGSLHAAGYILVVNTTADERNCVPLLERQGVREYFDFFATGDLSKSKIEKFEIICERYGCQPDDLLFITDTVGDVREAEVSGVPTIGVTWGAHNQKHFNQDENKNLINIVDSVDELKSVLLGEA